MTDIVNLAAYRQKKIEPPVGSLPANPTVAFSLECDLPLSDALTLLRCLRRADLDDIADRIETESEVTEDE
jgi:hypothetical protein